MIMTHAAPAVAIPPVRLRQDHKASVLLSTPVYTLPVKPSGSRLGLLGEPVEEMLQSVDSFPKRYWRGYVQALAIILYNTHKLSNIVEPDPQGLYALALPRRAHGFAVPRRYKVNEVGHALWCKLVDALMSAGLLEKLYDGFKGVGHCAGLTTLYRPTEAMNIWLDSVLERLSIEQLAGDSEQLILTAVDPKSQAQVLEDYLDDEKTQALRSQVRFISQVCQSHRIEGWIPPRQIVEALPSVVMNYRRNFRNCFDQGGRVFCPLQSRPKRYRRELRFDEKPTVELDYSSHQPRMCYHLNGLPAPEDCYYHPQIPRDLMKAATTRVMNCSGEAQALGALQKLLSKKRDDHQQAIEFSSRGLLDAVLSLHPVLKTMMGSQLWQKLQYEESCIALGVMERLAK